MDDKSAGKNSRPTILMVEDSPVQAMILNRVLMRHEYHVLRAVCGSEGLALVREHRPHLVISDVQMPDMSGFDMCRSIKNDPHLRHIPVILVTTLSNPESLIQGLEAGADSYVTKPYDEKFLVYRIESLIHTPVAEHTATNARPVKVNYAGKQYEITVDRMHILNLLLSTYENTLKQNEELMKAHITLKQMNQKLNKSYQEAERLLLNILPETVAAELKMNGESSPRYYEQASVMFTDFENFTGIAKQKTPQQLIRQLDFFFCSFDSIMAHYGLEKLKTIGDAYMCVGGIPEEKPSHAVDCVLTALEIHGFMNYVNKRKSEKSIQTWKLRLGIHSGPLVAGVTGEKKFAYDVWGDTVNVASRMESAGETGRINISGDTYNLIKDFFQCEFRGRMAVKNRGEIDMYYVERILPGLSRDLDGQVPNESFWDLYHSLFEEKTEGSKKKLGAHVPRHEK